MKTAACLALALASGLASAGTVKVNYVDPQNYRDMPFLQEYRDIVLKDLADHFAKRAEALPDGTSLNVEVLMLTRARWVDPSHDLMHASHARTGGGWPHIKIRYTLTDANGLIKSGEENVLNMAYANRANIYSTGDYTRYEKQMIDDWFRESIAAK